MERDQADVAEPAARRLPRQAASPPELRSNNFNGLTRADIRCKSPPMSESGTFPDVAGLTDDVGSGG
jgi:hypothetical protein